MGSATPTGRWWNRIARRAGRANAWWAYLGELDAQGRVAVQAQAAGTAHVRQQALEAEPEPQWVEVDLQRVRVERSREFGGPWLGLMLLQRLDLRRVLDDALPPRSDFVARHGAGPGAGPALCAVE